MNSELVIGKYYKLKTDSQTPGFEIGFGKYLGKVLVKTVSKEIYIFEMNTRGSKYDSLVKSKSDYDEAILKFLDKYYGKNQAPSNKRFYFRGSKSQIINQLSFKERYKITLVSTYD